MSFGDLVTLLVTFFILMIVLNKGEISRVQKWSETRLDEVARQLSTAVKDFERIKVVRTVQGVLVTIKADNAFVRGGFTPSEDLLDELKVLSVEIKGIKFLSEAEGGMPDVIAKNAKREGLKLFREISISGYTDNDPIDPNSRLRNNWFLSAMRAQSVMAALYQYTHFPPEQLSISGYGEYRPIASNDTMEGKRENRRIQLLIIAHFESK